MNKRKNVLIVAGVFPPEPIVSASIMYDLALELSKTCNVTVLRPKPTRPAGFKFENYDNSIFPFSVVEMDSYVYPKSAFIGRFKESVSSGLHAARYIDLHHDEIDFIYNDPWQLFGVNIVSRKAVKYGIPYMMAVQDVYPEALVSKLPPLLKKIASKILKPIDIYNQSHASRIHTISEKMVDLLFESRNVPREKYLCLRNWQNEQAWLSFDEQNVKREYSGMTFMYLGNVGPLAGLDIVINAFRDANLDNARLVIAGSGSALEGLKKIVENGNIANVEFRDVPTGMIQATQAQADVMILPVKKGGAMSSIPSKLPAYMFSAKPILASVDIESDTAQCIIDSDSGWVIPPEDKDCLVQMFRTIYNLESSTLREKGNNGKKFAMENLSRGSNLPRLITAVNKILHTTK